LGHLALAPSPERLSSDAPPAIAPSPPSADPELIRILEAHVKAAHEIYAKVYALHEAGAEGGSTVADAIAASHVFQAGAALAWSQGKARSTVSLLDHAVAWSELAAEAAALDFDADCATADSLLDLQEAAAKAKMNARSVRHSCEALGYDVREAAAIKLR
jgi:hypothetical protein